MISRHVSDHIKVLFLQQSQFVRSTLRQSRLNKAGLKCPSVRAYVHPFTKSFFDFNDIWHAGRGR